MKMMKRMAALLLTLCLLVGLPISVQATEEFSVVSAVEGPEYLVEEDVTWRDGMDAATYYNSWRNKTVLVTFNSRPTDESLALFGTAGSGGTVKARIAANGRLNGALTSDDMTGTYLGRYGNNGILIGCSGGSTVKYFDLLRSTNETKYSKAMGMTDLYVYFNQSSSGLSNFKNEDGSALTYTAGTKITVKQKTFDVVNVYPLPASQLGDGETEGCTWAVEFNENLASVDDAGQYRLQIKNVDGKDVDECTATFLRISGKKAIFKTATNRTWEYFTNKSSTGMTSSTNQGCAPSGLGIGEIGMVIMDAAVDDYAADRWITSVVSENGHLLPYTESLFTRNGVKYDAQANLYSPAFIGDTPYDSLSLALTAAKSGETVKMYGCADYATNAEVLMVPAGVTLDLNGSAIKTDAMVSFGDVIDSSNGIGGVIISNDPDKGRMSLSRKNTAMPLYETISLGDYALESDTQYDGTTGYSVYRFYAYELTEPATGGVKNGTTDKVSFGVQLIFDNTDAYDLLAEDANTTIEMDLAVTKDEKVTNLTFTFSSATLSTYSAQWKAGDTDNDPETKPTLILNVSGLSGISSISCTPGIYSTTDVCKISTQLSYDVPATE